MFFRKKITVAGTLAALVVLGIAASAPAEPTYKNLKVLPKNISHEELDSVMHQFNRSLGVKCSFCHAPKKDNPRKLDFASDDKGEKNVARDMMRMTDRINRKYFNYKKGDQHAIPPVGCMTCHNGTPHPEAMAPKEEKKEEKKTAPAAQQNSGQ
ncbi:c-type cytochrome [Longitalea luteola]|uniref:c-type cytochrome n=1 Tax=Longitalea luteola TaxID=2812563 RepID=UPI001A9735C0|nr:c-type cytochrome [Longitalea luteola]